MLTNLYHCIHKPALGVARGLLNCPANLLPAPLAEADRAHLTTVFVAFLLRNIRPDAEVNYLPQKLRDLVAKTVPPADYERIVRARMATFRDVAHAWSSGDALSASAKAFWERACVHWPASTPETTWFNVLPSIGSMLRDVDHLKRLEGWFQLVDWRTGGIGDLAQRDALLDACLDFCNDTTVSRVHRLHFVEHNYITRFKRVFTLAHVRSFYGRLAAEILDMHPDTMGSIIRHWHTEVSPAELWTWCRRRRLSPDTREEVDDERDRLFDPLRHDQRIVRALLAMAVNEKHPLDEQALDEQLIRLIEAMPLPPNTVLPFMRINIPAYATAVFYRKLAFFLTHTDLYEARSLFFRAMLAGPTPTLARLHLTFTHVRARRGDSDPFLADLLDCIPRDEIIPPILSNVRTALCRALGRPDPPSVAAPAPAPRAPGPTISSARPSVSSAQVLEPPGKPKPTSAQLLALPVKPKVLLPPPLPLPSFDQIAKHRQRQKGSPPALGPAPPSPSGKQSAHQQQLHHQLEAAVSEVNRVLQKTPEAVVRHYVLLDKVSKARGNVLVARRVLKDGRPPTPYSKELEEIYTATMLEAEDMLRKSILPDPTRQQGNGDEEDRVQDAWRQASVLMHRYLNKWYDVPRMQSLTDTERGAIDEVLQALQRILTLLSTFKQSPDALLSSPTRADIINAYTAYRAAHVSRVATLEAAVRARANGPQAEYAHAQDVFREAKNDEKVDSVLEAPFSS